MTEYENISEVRFLSFPQQCTVFIHIGYVPGSPLAAELLSNNLDLWLRAGETAASDHKRLLGFLILPK